MRMRGTKKSGITLARVAIAATGLFLATLLYADPHFGAMKFSTSHDDKAAGTEVFSTDTAKIFLHVELEEMASGTKLSSTWIAEKTDVTPPDYKIDSADFTVAEGMDEATFALNKPDAGWPTGDYRVDLFIDGKGAGSARFKIDK
jgi:hypothetical protein